MHAAGRIERVVIAFGSLGPRQKEVIRLAESMGIKIEQRSRKELDSMTGEGSHQGVVVFAEGKEVISLADMLGRLKEVKAPVLLVLDGITDPRNLGAIIRSVEALGGQGVIIGKDRSAGLSPAAVKASAGAVELVPVASVVNISRSLRLLKEAGFWVVGTAADAAKKCFELDWGGRTAVVLGSEGKGLRRLVRENCDEVVSIPLRGRITSLNVASCAAIILYEIVKQRGGQRPI